VEAHYSLMTWVALGLAGFAAVAILGFLVRRPPLVFATKVGLVFALGVLPISAAMLGNVQAYQTMKKRTFCGSCHVMERHYADASDPENTSLAAIHSRNPAFGGESCYRCHADYGMLGGVFTKLDGAGHLYHYAREYRDAPMPDALRTIRLRRPYPNRNCMQCHSATAPVFLAQPDHAAQRADIVAGRTSCVGSGCHGPAHPFSKPYQAGQR